jgi:tetratricopeptide (TPR) repeat protein
MSSRRFRCRVSRLLALLFVSGGLAWGGLAQAQDAVSPLPPPMTRGLYRSRWFEFLDAHLEDDSRAAAAALAELKRAAQMVGIHSLSDFSRTAAYEGRHAEAQGRFDSAARAYDAALVLDDGNCEAQFARVGFLLRQRSFQKAAAALPGAASSLLATHESRVSFLSMLLLWAAVGLAAATLCSIVVLIVRHSRLWIHDLREMAGRFFGPRSAAPLGLVFAALPLAFGLGPLWLVLYWGALVYPSCHRKERGVLGTAFVAVGLIPVLMALVSRENILERSPLYVAAVDLDERREDASAEDGLRQASTVFGEDSDVWLLLGIYAERYADPERALAAYDRAVRAGPDDYHPLLNRGNIHYQEGNFAQAIRDYEAAAEKAPHAAEVYYNLALARTEAYDFEGQAAALRRAREISARDVAYWSDHPTLARVVSVSYPVSRARRKIEEWNSQPRGRRLPGYAPFLGVLEAFISPFSLGPWAVLVLALALRLLRTWRGMARECVQCGQPTCKYCRRYGDPPGLCSACSRQRKESRVIEVQVKRAGEARRLARRRVMLCRVLSVFFPGAHGFFSKRPVSGFLTLLLFFFLFASAVINSRLFSPRQLAPTSTWTGLSLAGLVAAALVWALSLRSSWRRPHGA